MIIRPITITRKNEDDETEGEELPPAEVPGWDLDTALSKLNIRRVPFRLLDGNTAGYSIGRDLAVNPEQGRPCISNSPKANVSGFGGLSAVMAKR